MALQSSGTIKMSDICVELGLAPTTNISLNDSRCRKLAKKETAGTTISMSDFYGKASFDYEIILGAGVYSIDQSMSSPLIIAFNITRIQPLSNPTLASSFTRAEIIDSAGKATSYTITKALPANNNAAVTFMLSTNTQTGESSIQLICKVAAGGSANPAFTAFRIVFYASDGTPYELFKHRNIPYGGYRAAGRGQMSDVMAAYIAALPAVPPNYP